MTELYPNIYTTQIPLRNSPLKWLNCYFIRGGQRNLIIDTAFNTAESWEAMQAAMAELGFTLDNTDLLCTHLHVDHCGLMCKMKSENNKVYMGTRDADHVLNYLVGPNPFDFSLTIETSGTPAELALSPGEHVSETNGPDHMEIDITRLVPGDVIDVGDYHFRVMDFSGHTPGQIGLYEPEHQLLFSADHILGKITPNIASWDMENDYLGMYMKNLEALLELPIKKVFTAHRELPEDAHGRIKELLSHHETRLQEVLRIMGEYDRPCTAFEVARHMTWSYRSTFMEFPPMQKWFACNEALAHLQYLRFRNKVRLTGSAQERPYFYELVKEEG